MGGSRSQVAVLRRALGFSLVELLVVLVSVTGATVCGVCNRPFSNFRSTTITLESPGTDKEARH